MVTALFILTLAVSVYVAMKAAKDEQLRQAWRQRCRVDHFKA